jgi:hypothetical protein
MQQEMPHVAAAKNPKCELKIPRSKQTSLRLRSHGKLCPVREQNWEVVASQVYYVVECCMLSSYDDDGSVCTGFGSSRLGTKEG